MNTAVIPPSRNLWPYAIVTWFIIFIAALVAWVSLTVRQKTDLVSPDYYEQEVRFQRHLDSLNRTAPLRGQIAIQYDAPNREVAVRVPTAHLGQSLSGEIHLYRPSNAALDIRVPLAVDGTGTQRIGAQKLRGGLWNARLQWTAAGQEYFLEQVIVVDEPTPEATAR